MKPRVNRPVAVLLLAIVLQAIAPVAASEDWRTVDDCDRHVLRSPQDLEGYRCYWAIARRTGAPDDAIRRLESMLSLHPDEPRAQLYLGAIRADLGQRDRALELYGSAAEAFRREGEARGEVYARISRYELLARLGAGLGDEELERAEQVAEAAGERQLLLQVRMQRGWAAYKAADYGRALSLFRAAEDEVFPDGNDYVKRLVLDGLGAAWWSLDRNALAFDCYQRELDLLDGTDPVWAAGIWRNLALVAAELWVSGDLQREEVVRIREEGLRQSIASGHRRAEATLRLMLAATHCDDVALIESQRALAIAIEIDDPTLIIEARLRIAEHLCGIATDEAFAHALEEIEQAAALAEQIGSLRLQIDAGESRAVLGWLMLPREQAISVSLASLTAAEQIRRLQPLPSIGRAAFQRYTATHRMLVQGLLDAPEGVRTSDDVDLAFRISERIRGEWRIHLDEGADGTGGEAPVTAAAATSEGVQHGAPGGDAVLQRQQRLAAIGTLQRRLLNPALETAERDELLVELRGLENEEFALRDALARERGRACEPPAPSMAAVQQALGPDQSLIVYFLPPGVDRVPLARGSIDSWAFVVSRGSAEAVRLPPLPQISERIELYLALLERRDRQARQAAAALFDDLLAEPMSRVPAGVRQLLIVPDRGLERLPFPTLRRTADGAPLVEDYSLSLSPSIRTWLAWTKRDPPACAALSLADPALPGTVESHALERAGVFEAGMTLGRLPHARLEAGHFATFLKGAARVLLDEEATERALKRDGAFAGFGVLHLATHVVVDDDHPERSAIVLAPGSSDEDGLLQYREVLDLELDGRLVLLTGCRSASGPLTEGAGVSGLAQAFLSAGARAVVASLWPLRDDETAVLVKHLVSGLAAGLSAGEALRGAQRTMLSAGAPEASWGGLAVFGDGTVRPFEPRRRPWWWIGLPTAAGALLLVGCSQLARLVRRSLTARRAGPARAARRRRGRLGSVAVAQRVGTKKKSPPS